MGKQENIIQKQAIDYLTVRGWKVYRINNGAVYNKRADAWIFHGTAGVPDLYAMKEGMPVLWVECKVGKNKPSPYQVEFMELAKMTLNGWAVIIHNLDDLIEAERGIIGLFKINFK